MGIANIIPGVSGGTIKLITNIYRRLNFSLKSFNYKALKLILNLKFKDFSKHVNLKFISLFSDQSQVFFRLQNFLSFYLKDTLVIFGPYFWIDCCINILCR